MFCSVWVSSRHTICIVYIPAVCQDVQLRHWLEENMWRSVCCVCRGLPGDSTGDFPQQVSFSPEMLFFSILGGPLYMSDLYMTENTISTWL